MAVSLSVPTNTSWVEQNIELSNISYNFIFSLNTRTPTPRLYLDIFIDEDPVITGIKLLGNTDLFYNKVVLDFIHGKLFCLNVSGTEEPATLGNIGIGLDYQLIYFTNEELSVTA